MCIRDRSWPTPGFKGRTFKLCVLTRWNFNFCVRSSPLRAKLMANNTSGINTEIKINGQKLETVTKFKYLGSVITDEGSKPEIFCKIALTRLKPFLNDSSISHISKIWLICSFVTSVGLYAYESWILTTELQRRMHAMEMRCYCKILCIICKDHVANKESHAKIQQAIRLHEDLLTSAKSAN